ncbi:uncharacterized protein LOC122639102 [Telopea speciosissima]|uniref:uncharacterized protein LOC122639102 n=1 Tax=Telopea speciosissima TaxID=54955 RepID=UPI001CC7EF79|nr:uncharacterized protein LOC122639102 [Telopea speciosissima]
MALTDLEQKSDETVSVFLQRAKSVADELVAAGHPLRPGAFNLHVYRGLKPEFKSMVSSLLTRTDPIEYDDLHAMLLSHEFLHGTSLKKLTITEPAAPGTQISTNNVQRSSSTTPSASSPPSRGGRGGWWGSGGRSAGLGRGSPMGCGRFWCSICWRTNHSTDRCFYRQQNPSPYHFPPPTPTAHYSPSFHRSRLGWRWV